MSCLEGRVAIVTGAGRGLGRAHALALAGHGARVVVNDVGADPQGHVGGSSPAHSVAEEIRSGGGDAVSSTHDVSVWDDAGALVNQAIDFFGALDILVNNAGILRDRSIANMTEGEWDDVVRVNLKGHFAPSRHAMTHWRSCAKRGVPVQASVVHTTSLAGIAGNFGQANYASAKLALLALSRVMSIEGKSFGVRSNAVSPSARTRLAATSPQAHRMFDAANTGEGGLDAPERVSPLVVWLARAGCPATGQIYHIAGRRVLTFAMPVVVDEIVSRDPWSVDALDEALRGRLIEPKEVFDCLALLKQRRSHRLETECAFAVI